MFEVCSICLCILIKSLDNADNKYFITNIPINILKCFVIKFNYYLHSTPAAMWKRGSDAASGIKGLLSGANERTLTQLEKIEYCFMKNESYE